MFTNKDLHKITFYGIGLGMIVFGAVIFAFSLAAWFLSYFGYNDVCSFPFFKLMGSTIIIGIGYIVLELELLRKK